MLWSVANIKHIHIAKNVFFFGLPSCNSHLATKALDLINRQQAEIERLQMMINSDNEVCTECHCEYMDKVHQARIEAIKEFARRLKAKAKDEFMHDYKMLTMATEFVIVKEIDNLVKEMVGEE